MFDLTRPLRILFIGNSILAHDPSPASGWYWYWGMAATQASYDYVHRVALGMAARLGIVPDIRLMSGDINRVWGPSDVDGRTFDGVTTVSEFAPDVVIVQMGDNAPLDADPARWLAISRQIVAWTPSATLRIAVGLWATPVDAREQIVKNAAIETSMVYVAIHDLHIEGVTDGTPHGYADGGVRWHPGNLGMRLISERMLAAINVAEGV